MLEEHIDNNVCHSILLKLNNKTDTIAIRRLIIHIRDTLNTTILNQLANSIAKFILTYHIRHLGKDNLLTIILSGLNLVLSTDNHATTTCKQRLLNTCITVEDTTCREVWTLNKVEKLLALTLRIIDICTTSIYNLTKVVWSHICCHTYCNTTCTIYKQKRNSCRQYCRLELLTVKVWSPVDSLLVNVRHNLG